MTDATPTTRFVDCNSAETLRADVLVVGGGITGAALALALAEASPDACILLAEPGPPPLDERARVEPFAPDLRVSALNLQSEHFLRSIGAWDFLDSSRLKTYNSLKVSERPFGMNALAGSTTFSASDLDDRDIDHLGVILENNGLQQAIWKALRLRSNVSLLRAELVDLLELGALKADAVLRCQDTGAQITVSTRVLVGADGAASSLRAKAGLRQFSEGYSQKALVIGVELAEAAGHRTWQVFRPQGPLAYLPLFDCPAAEGSPESAYASLVWYDDPERIQKLMQLDTSALLAEVLEAFPELPRVRKLYARASFPLVKSHCPEYFRHCAVLIGDAAHTINPLAGQGLNLGLQDAEVLAAVLSAALAGMDAGAITDALRQYERKRKPQNLLMTATIDAFYYGFSNNNAPLKLMRNLGLTLANYAGPIKQRVLRRALGLDQPLKTTSTREVPST